MVTTKNSLKRQEVFLVRDWVDKNWEDIVKAKPTYPEAAKAASSCLGFNITEHNLRGIVINMKDKEWPRKKKLRVKVSKQDEVAFLAKQIRTLNDFLLLILEDLEESHLIEKYECRFDLERVDLLAAGVPAKENGK